jgi:hypothetical protein
MKFLSMLVVGSFALASAAQAKCLWDCPEFRLGIESTLTVTDGETSQERRLFGITTIPIDTLLNGGRGEIVLGLSEPFDFAHPLLGTEKISGVVGISYTPSEHFTPATALVLLPLRDLKETLTPGGARFRLYAPIPRTRWLPDPFFETDARSFSGGLSIAIDTSGRRLFGSYSFHNSIPEPATWAMMIGGFGLVGITLRRQAMTVARAA